MLCAAVYVSIEPAGSIPLPFEEENTLPKDSPLLRERNTLRVCSKNYQTPAGSNPLPFNIDNSNPSVECSGILVNGSAMLCAVNQE